MAEFTLQQIAQRLELDRERGGDRVIRGVGEIDHASPEQIAFAESPDMLERVKRSAAALVLVSHDFPEVTERPVWRVENPRIAFLKIAELFVRRHGCDGIHPDASIHPDARLEAGVSVGPRAVIGAGARVGSGSCIGAGAFVGDGVSIGRDCLVEPNASLLAGTELGDRVIIRANAAIGSEGFGFAWMQDHHHRIPQLGRVVIEDDVEIGCGSCVDRATLGVTRIGRGCKIDNLVHVAHNCDIGRHALLLAQVCIAGSSRVGDHSILSGQVGVSDHISIGNRVMVGGQSGVTKDLPDGETAWGWPARNIKKAMREQAAVSRLPDLTKQVRQMEKRIEELQAALARLEQPEQT